MKKRGSKVRAAEVLRSKAEALVEQKIPKDAKPRAQDPNKLLHELQVHQIELQMQNEQLQETQIELERSRDEYQRLYDLAPVAYLMLDPKSRILDANQTARALLGVERKTVIGRRLSSFMTTQDAETFHLHQQRVFASDARHVCNLDLKTELRGAVPVQVDSVSLRDQEGAQLRCLCVLTDLSARKQAEAKLRTTEDRLRQIAEHVNDVFFVHECDQTISYVSPAFESVWGRSAAELIYSREWLDSIHIDDRERVVQSYMDMLKGEPFDAEFRIVPPDGEIRWVRGRSFPVRDEQGRLLRDVGTIQDITKERQLQEELRQAQKMEAIGAFASGISHDFGNILQAILGCASVVVKERTPPETARMYAGHIMSAVRRGARLVAQLMAFSRRKPIQLVPTDIPVVIDSCAPLLQRLLGAPIWLDVGGRAMDATVLADPSQIEQILLNLAANARDAMPHGGKFSLRTEKVFLDNEDAQQHGLSEGPYLKLVVQDTGSGMDEATQQRIFQPFFSTKSAETSTGLGLSTVFAITRNLKGHVHVESEPGQGTTFVFYFPCCADKPAYPTDDRATPQFRGHVLLVEDEPLVRLALHHHLSELGFDVLETDNAEEAIEMCNTGSEAIDLLVTDVILPGMTGSALAERLRQQQPGLRVLYISAHAAAELIDKGMVAIDAHHLHKPFGKVELAGMIAGIFTGIFEPRGIVEVSKSSPDAAAATILVVEDEEGSRLALRYLLEDVGYQVLEAATPFQALDLAGAYTEPIHILLTDVKLPGMRGDELADKLRASRPGLKVIYMSGLVELPATIVEVVQKPIEFDDLLRLVERTLAVEPQPDPG